MNDETAIGEESANRIDTALQRSPIPWRKLTRDELVTVCVWADRTGHVSHLKAARAALRRRDGLGR